MKRSLFFAVSVMLTLTLMAGPVSQETARQQALEFVKGKSSSAFLRAQAASADLTLAASGEAYHVFNVGEGEGFVVVSGTDYAPGVLGYAEEGTFDASNLPGNMKAWLQGYADQVAWLESHGGQLAEVQVNSRRAASVKASIAPIVKD